MGLFPTLPNPHKQVAWGPFYFQKSPSNFPSLHWELGQWNWTRLCTFPSQVFVMNTLYTSSPNCSISLCSCSELPPKEQQMFKMTRFFMVLQLSVALWIAAIKLTVEPGLLSSCSANFWAGAEVLCCLSESAPCLYLSLQLLHTGDCRGFFMRRIIYLFSYAETDQASRPGWRKITTVVGNGLIKSWVSNWRSVLPSSWPL